MSLLSCVTDCGGWAFCLNRNKRRCYVIPIQPLSRVRSLDGSRVRGISPVGKEKVYGGKEAFWSEYAVDIKIEINPHTCICLSRYRVFVDVLAELQQRRRRGWGSVSGNHQHVLRSGCLRRRRLRRLRHCAQRKVRHGKCSSCSEDFERADQRKWSKTLFVHCIFLETLETIGQLVL